MADISKIKTPDGTTYDLYDKIRYNKTVSRGEQLVVNGNGMMGDNTNFSYWEFDGSYSNSSPGSFTRTSTSYADIISDEFFPVNASEKYKFEFDLISKNNTGTMYAYLSFCDVDKIPITASNTMYYSGTLTTLARELKAGDTKVYLTDASAYRTYGTGSHLRALIFWDYKNSFGYQYPPETYSRHILMPAWTDDSSIDKTNNIITLTTAYTGITHPAGTYVSQGCSGGTYKYSGITGQKVPTEWTHYTGYFDGTDYSGLNKYGTFAPATAYCKVGFLWDYNSANDQFWVTNVSVKEVPALAKTAETATSANNATSATIARDVGETSITLHLQSSNEINIGGSFTGNTDLFIGYRAIGNRQIPTRFVFGGSSGTATIQAAKFTGNAASASILKHSTALNADTIDDFHPADLAYANVSSLSGIGLAGSDGVLVWIPYNANYGRQIIFDDTTHTILSRTYNQGTWSAWLNLTAEATTSVKGITKLNTATNSTSTTEAATPSAVKTAYDLANTANTTANTALSGVSGTLIYDHTYSISSGVATFTAHVYCKGQEVTSTYADSCFTWSYRLDSAISGTPSVVSLGTGKTKTITISTLGYGGHVIGSFTPPA